MKTFKKIDWNLLNLLLFMMFSLISLKYFLDFVDNYERFDDLTSADSASIKKILDEHASSRSDIEKELRISIERAIEECRRTSNNINLNCDRAKSNVAMKVEQLEKVSDLRVAYKSIKSHIEYLRVKWTGTPVRSFIFFFFIQTIFGVFSCASYAKPIERGRIS